MTERKRNRTNRIPVLGFTLIELLVVHRHSRHPRGTTPSCSSPRQGERTTGCLLLGESALVKWGRGNYGDQGWIRYNRHGKGANYIYTDSHVEHLRWSKARSDQYPDHRVRSPLNKPPE